MHTQELLRIESLLEVRHRFAQQMCFPLRGQANVIFFRSDPANLRNREKRMRPRDLNTIRVVYPASRALPLARAEFSAAARRSRTCCMAAPSRSGVNGLSR